MTQQGFGLLECKIFIILNENENAKILRLLLYFFIDENTKGNLAIIM